MLCASRQVTGLSLNIRGRRASVHLWILKPQELVAASYFFSQVTDLSLLFMLSPAVRRRRHCFPVVVSVHDCILKFCEHEILQTACGNYYTRYATKVQLGKKTNCFCTQHSCVRICMLHFVFYILCLFESWLIVCFMFSLAHRFWNLTLLYATIYFLAWFTYWLVRFRGEKVKRGQDYEETEPGKKITSTKCAFLAVACLLTVCCRRWRVICCWSLTHAIIFLHFCSPTLCWCTTKKLLIHLLNQVGVTTTTSTTATMSSF